MGKVVRALAALVALAIAVVGVPVFLVVAVGNPWPGSEAIELRDTSAMVVGVLGAIGWVVWARLVVSIVLEAIEQIRQVRDYRAAVRADAADEPFEPFEIAPPASNGPTGQLAHSLIAALLVLIPLVRSAPIHGPVPELPTRPAVAQTFETITSSPAAPVQHQMRRSASATTVTIVSEPGDTLIGLAERHLGDAGRWREIFDLNRDTRQLDGRLATPSSLRAGWTLQMPADVTTSAVARERVGANGHVGRRGSEAGRDGGGRRVEPAAVQRDASRTPADSAASPDDPPARGRSTPPVARYVVQAGDGPWDVADALLGDGMRYQEVLDANVGREVAPGVTWTADQRAIHPGWVFIWGEEAADPASRRSAPAETETETVTVESGDTLWDLIKEESAEPVSWSEVEEVAQRNDGTATPDGAFVFDEDNPDLIHPGQRFALADGETFADDHEPGGERRDRPAVDNQAPDNNAAAASGDHRDSAGDRDPVDGDERDGTSPSDGAQREERAQATPAPSTPTTPTTPTTTPVAGDGSASSESSSSGLPAPVPLGLGVAALSAGLLGLVEVARRRRLRSAKVRDRLPSPPEHVVRTERRLRALGPNDRLVRVDVALRSAARAVVDGGRRVTSVMAHPDQALLLFTDGAVDLPDPWTPAGSTRTAWTLPAEVPLEQLAASTSGVGAPCAAFTPIGAAPSGADVFVDVEAAGVFAIDTYPDAADTVLAGIAAGLASSVFAESAHLIGVGMGTGCFMDHPNHRLVDSVAEASAVAEQLLGDYQDAYDSTFVLRTRGTSGETWEPVVVLVSSDHLDEVSQWTPQRGATVVVAGNPVTSLATTVLRPDADVWMLEPPGIELSPVGLTVDELAEIEALLAWERHGEPIPALADGSAVVVGSVDTWETGAEVDDDTRGGHSDGDDSGDDAGDDEALPEVAAGEPFVLECSTPDSEALLVAPREDPDAEFTDAVADDRDELALVTADGDDVPAGAAVATPGASAPTQAVAEPDEPDWDIMVRVLGLVDVIDRQDQTAAFSKSKSVELLAWLGLHRDRATRTGARSALWEVDVRDATFTNIVSEARRGMARLVSPAEGQEWLGRTLSAALPLHERVVTDVDVLDHYRRQAEGQPPEQARASLTRAAALIRGMPFAEAGYIWPDAEGITSRLVMMVTTCTAELAELALQAGDLDSVFWATGVGLQVLSGQEELIALRMRAHAHRSDLSGIRHEWEAYERVLASDPWSDGEPSPTLVALRHELVAGGHGR